MECKHLLLLVLFYFCIDSTDATPFLIINTDHQLDMRNQTEGEQLPNCLPRAVCGVVHKRFWLTPIVRPFCKCQASEECATRWHHISDTRTMQLDSRSQIKFCSHVTDLQSCATGQTAIKIESIMNEETGHEQIKAVVSCNCQWPAHWTLERHTYSNYSNGTTVSNDTYTCDYLKKCQKDEFCGNIRADTSSAYYQCYCPMGTLCLKKDKTKDYASELLYQGPIYRGICRPFNIKSKG